MPGRADLRGCCRRSQRSTRARLPPRLDETPEEVLLPVPPERWARLCRLARSLGGAAVEGMPSSLSTRRYRPGGRRGGIFAGGRYGRALPAGSADRRSPRGHGGRRKRNLERLLADQLEPEDPCWRVCTLGACCEDARVPGE